MQPITSEILYRYQVKALVESGLYTLSKAKEIVKLQQAHSSSATTRASAASTAAAMAATDENSINPYAPLPRGKAVIDVAVQPVRSQAVYVKYRFDENYIFGVEEVPLEKDNMNQASYTGWSIKRVGMGEDDTPEYVGKDGKLKKRFNFSGSLKTLPELHKALKQIELTSTTVSALTKSAAAAMEADGHGFVDISTASKPEYTSEIFMFGSYRVYVEDVTYSVSPGQWYTYKAIIITKEKSEKSRGKSKSDKGWFSVNVPARRLPQFLMAVELAMEANGLNQLPIDDKPTDKEEDMEEVDGKRKERRIKRIRKSAKIITMSDSEDEEEDAGADQPTASDEEFVVNDSEMESASDVDMGSEEEEEEGESDVEEEVERVTRKKTSRPQKEEGKTVGKLGAAPIKKRKK